MEPRTALADPQEHLERIAAVRAGESGARVPYPIGIRELEVRGVRRLTAALARLTLGGPGLAGFQSHVPEEHVRLIFPDERGELRLPEPDGLVLRWPRPLPVSREYTVRRHDPRTGELDVDLVLHPGGLAARWVRTARVGERIPVAGPPGGFVLPAAYDRYLFAGDLTALPQIARYLEWLPADATGWAVVEVGGPDERLELTAPAGVDVRWVERGGCAPGEGDALERAVRALPVPAGGRTFAWVAGEAGAVKPLRGWLRRELGLAPADHVVTGYWKRGVADFDDHD
jgi:NADPH-dependent ferric siderophore reductase